MVNLLLSRLLGNATKIITSENVNSPQNAVGGPDGTMASLTQTPTTRGSITLQLERLTSNALTLYPGNEAKQVTGARWDVEISNDGTTWQPIARQVDAGAWPVKTIKLPYPRQAIKAARITMTAPTYTGTALLDAIKANLI